jgi:hypothetical protein
MTSPRRAPLWVVTSLFNPAGYRRKVANYRLFRERLGLPLVAVELGYGGRFALGRTDADIVVRVRDGDVLWQKERLLNLGIRALPADCEAVAWVDCDVIFGSRDWAERARAELEQADLVHLFRDRHNLPRDTPVDRIGSWSEPVSAVSLVHRLATGQQSPQELTRNNSALETRSTTGLGWAMRREVVDRHGLYDACVLGGGDRVMLASAYGRLDLARQAQHMSARRAEHYLGWARPYFSEVAGRVSSIPGRAFHLWHGELEDRRYETRFDLLADFDPFTDIAPGADGAWRWSSDKRRLHAMVERYFHRRNEDGERPTRHRRFGRRARRRAGGAGSRIV